MSHGRPPGHATTSPTRGAPGVGALLAPGVAASPPAAEAAADRGRRGGAKAKTDTLVIANAVKVDTLDPAANSVNESIWLTQNIYRRLIQPNANGTDVDPELATSWTSPKDGMTYTFHLRRRSSRTARRSPPRTPATRSSAR